MASVELHGNVVDSETDTRGVTFSWRMIPLSLYTFTTEEEHRYAVDIAQSIQWTVLFLLHKSSLR